jgi:hypothetical protein
MRKFLHRRSARVGLLGLMVLGLGFGAIASAVSTPLPTEFTSGGVRWGDLTQDSTGFYNVGNTCNLPEDGFAMGDAMILATNQTDAFDDAGMVRIGDEYFAAPGGVNAPVDLTGTTLQTPPGPLGGLNVSVQWHGAASAPVVRELVALENPTGAAISQQVRIDTGYGSDDGTYLWGSSSGDETWTTADRWITTADDNAPFVPPLADYDPPVTSVWYGPGTVLSPAALVENCDTSVNSLDQAKPEKRATAAEETTTTVDGGDGAAPSETAAPAADTAPPDVSAQQTILPGDGNWSEGYNVSVPPGETRYLMMFFQLTPTPEEGLSAGATFNTNPATNSDLLAGITGVQLQQIVNWTFPIEIRFTG